MLNVVAPTPKEDFWIGANIPWARYGNVRVWLPPSAAFLVPLCCACYLPCSSFQ